jgi:predicted DCC family thiol-disulfide oxidoreductase YuxK
VILFDGVCNLCNAFVQFIIDRDPRARFSFAALQSDAAAQLLSGQRRTAPVLDSVVLVEQGRLAFESTAVLRIARRLGFPWALAYAFIVVPRPLRDWAYRLAAPHRYRWFGRRDRCMVPTADIRARFLS